MKLLHMMVVGFILLAWALFLNAFASKIGVMNWYDFLKGPGDAKLIDLLWLLIAYPFGLGIVGYSVSKWILEFNGKN